MPRVRPRVVPPHARVFLFARPVFPLVAPLVGGPPLPPALLRFPTYAPWPYTFWSPPFLYVGDTAGDHPELIFTDGTTYFVRDYWRTDDQLHFIRVEGGGAKSAEQVVPFSSLDVQRTADANAARGFRFVLRNAPFVQ